MTLPISVNICALNEEVDIARCLELVKVNRPFEIIVIDGGSSDRTREISESLGAKVLSSKPGLSSQRKIGIEASTQDFIAIIDADDYLTSDFLSKLFGEMIEYDFDAILGREFPMEPSTYWEKAMGSVNGLATFTDFPVETNMVGRPAIYRTKAIRHCSFDSFFDGAGCEDADLSIRMEYAGFRQGIGTAVVYRRQTPDFKGLMKKFLKYGRGDARLCYKYPSRKSNVLKHILINYPIKKSIAAILRGDWKYLPIYPTQGLVRFFAFIKESIKLKLNSPAVGKMPPKVDRDLFAGRNVNEV